MRFRGCDGENRLRAVNGGRHGQVSMFATKTVQKGVYSTLRGKCRPSGRRRFANRQVSMLGMKPVQRGVHPAPGGECGPPTPNRRERDASIRPYPTGTIRRSSGGSGAGSGSPPPPLVEAARITCNTYSPAYKGKSLKKRLSPKSLNTLIHSYVTFYIFLIFQYLSLWKSVFSSN